MQRSSKQLITGYKHVDRLPPRYNKERVGAVCYCMYYRTVVCISTIYLGMYKSYSYLDVQYRRHIVYPRLEAQLLI